jgi:hypothetical protein
MPIAPEYYDDIRDNQNRKWSCSIDRGSGFYSGVSIRNDTLSITYDCIEELTGQSFKKEVEVYFTDAPRLESSIAKQLYDGVREV